MYVKFTLCAQGDWDHLFISNKMDSAKHKKLTLHTKFADGENVPLHIFFHKLLIRRKQLNFVLYGESRDLFRVGRSRK